MARKFLQYLTLAVIGLTVLAWDLPAKRLRQLPDSIPVTHADSLKAAARDSLQRADSLAAAKRDSLDVLNKSSLERPAFSTAKDSIITDFSNGKRMVYYYGGATVTYQNMQLTADYIEYDMKTNTVDKIVSRGLVKLRRIIKEED